MLLDLFYLTLILVCNTGIIAALWYNDNYTHFLRKFLFVSVLIAFVFSGNIITLFGAEFNIGFIFLLNYYIIAFCLVHTYGITKYYEILLEHIHMFIIAAITVFPLMILLESGEIAPAPMNFTNLIEVILKERFNYMFIIFFTFYFGQLTYISSFLLVKKQSFYFEFIGRLSVCMLIQSTLFYYIQYLIFNKIPGIGQLFYNLVITGFLLRLSLLLLCSFPFKYIYEHRKSNERQITF